LGLVLSALPARGAEQTPRLEISIPIEVQNDWTYDSDDAANRHNQLFPKIEPEATLHVMPGLSLVGHAVIEPVREAEAGEDRYFEDVGVFMEELYADYAFSRYGLRGGKFGVAFGVGWDITPGVYGTDFAEAGYELTERIGLAGRAKLETEAAGAYTFIAHGFFRDTTVLSESLGRGRGTTDHGDGGVSNTEDLSSYALTLDGENLAGVTELGARLSFVRQARGVDSTEAETGISAALWHKMKLGKGLTLSPMIEYVHYDDADGVSGQDRDFLTLAGRLDWQSWNLALAYTGRDTDATGGGDVNDFQFQVSAGYAFDFGLEFDVGWQIVNEGGIESQRIGLLAAYALKF
jgi:hypothetical protein